MKSFGQADVFCKDQNASLLTIHFQEEQDFIKEFFESQKISNDVWIGVKYENKKYKWNDDTDVVYQNWAPGSPKHKDDHCVQFQSDETSFGKWSDVLCSKMNMVVCQKMQAWTPEHMKSLLLSLMKNPVPIGFTYVQLPHEKAPGEIWPWMIWENVSKNYSGVFFRVVGGEAKPFGEIQKENAPRIHKVNAVSTNDAKAWPEAAKHRATNDNIMDIPLNASSPYVLTGGVPPAAAPVRRYVSFESTGGEVRSVNMAIQVCRRIS